MREWAPCGIRHVDLAEEPVGLAAAPGERAVHAVFWWRSMPVGARLFTAGELPVPPAAVRALGASLAALALYARGGRGTDRATLDAVIPAPSATLARQATVVVCTRNRPADLARCLDALARLDPRPASILVVDNAPENPRTRDIVAARADLRYIAEPKPGLSRARNTGLRAVATPIIAFTDDDAEVAPGWLGTLVAPFADPTIGWTTGLVLPAALDSDAAFCFEHDYDGFGRGFAPLTHGRRFLDRPFCVSPPVWTLGAGASMAIRRSMVLAIGGFDTRLGAGASGCSEDSEFWRRALEAGWSGRYEPAAVIHHHHRADLDGLGRQMRAYMRGHGAALLVQFARTRHAGDLLRLFVGLPVHYAAVALRLALAGPSMRRRMLPFEVLGLLEAPFWWLRHGRVGGLEPLDLERT